MRDTERERQRHKQRKKQTPCREPNVGLDPGTPGSRPGPKAGAKPLSHPGIPVPIIFKHLHSSTERYLRFIFGLTLTIQHFCPSLKLLIHAL